ncbi:MAG: metalloregulator ArsR/SmtB family transcription factor [Limimaricola sp.]|uniref:ArsR/SmtB family transcription factor n=1 Tax=Limimaricola sp. TaxID=2211665 RepID=UPI001D1F128C|nr:metalloregulator ArsR/SmtB family transcription factor [Limimaricola sp.]MBI1416480.1 metalloregulator ArsR/SmtB family transcription factor [Limimaricola sp.]
MTNADAISAAIGALADPTRRQIVNLLRAGPMSVGELAAGLPVSRPAVSQHLAVMTAAGLLSAAPQGNRRIYALDPSGIDGLRTYLDTLWDDALAGFAAAARAQERTER